MATIPNKFGVFFSEEDAIKWKLIKGQPEKVVDISKRRHEIMGVGSLEDIAVLHIV